MLANSATKTKPTKQATTSMDKSFMRGIMLKWPGKVKREQTAPKTRPKNSPIAPTSSPSHPPTTQKRKNDKIGIFGRFFAVFPAKPRGFQASRVSKPDPPLPTSAFREPDTLWRVPAGGCWACSISSKYRLLAVPEINLAQKHFARRRYLVGHKCFQRAPALTA